MADSPRFRSHLPHWGWFLLATIVLVVGVVGLSLWWPYHREQQMILKIEAWGGNVKTESGGPEWLRRLVGNSQMSKFKVFDWIREVHLEGTAITDVEIAQLSEVTNLISLNLNDTEVTDVGLAKLNRLTSLEEIHLRNTAVTQKGIEEVRKTSPQCEICDWRKSRHGLLPARHRSK